MKEILRERGKGVMVEMLIIQQVSLSSLIADIVRDEWWLISNLVYFMISA